MAGILTISGTQTGLPEGSTTAAISQALTMSATDEVLNVAASGDNTITVPATAAGCLITPPVANAVVLKIKGAGGDTGVAINPAGPTLLNFAATPPASFIINAASAPSGPIVVRFI